MPWGESGGRPVASRARSPRETSRSNARRPAAPKSPKKARDGPLSHCTLPQQVVQDLRTPLEAIAALRMRQNRQKPGEPELEQRFVRPREPAIVGHLDDECLACGSHREWRQFGGSRGKSHVEIDLESLVEDQRKPRRLKSLSQFGHGSRRVCDHRATDIREVRRTHHLGDPLPHRLPSHGDTLLHGVGPVIESRQKMGMRVYPHTDGSSERDSTNRGARFSHIRGSHGAGYPPPKVERFLVQ